MKIPLVIREIESRTDDLEEKAIITRIHEMKEHSLSKLDKYTTLQITNLTWQNYHNQVVLPELAINC